MQQLGLGTPCSGFLCVLTGCGFLQQSPSYTFVLRARAPLSEGPKDYTGNAVKECAGLGSRKRRFSSRFHGGPDGIISTSPLHFPSSHGRNSLKLFLQVRLFLGPLSIYSIHLGTVWSVGLGINKCFDFCLALLTLTQNFSRHISLDQLMAAERAAVILMFLTLQMSWHFPLQSLILILCFNILVPEL